MAAACGSAVLFVLVGGLGLGAAASESAAKPTVERASLPGGYCGLSSLLAVLRMLGKEVTLEQLLEPRYLGSSRGSSMAELKQAAEDFGAWATPLGGLTIDALAASPQPIILHVAARGQSAAYDHWVLFLGVENGKAKILDGAAPVELVSFAELLARWDNTGLLVSDGPAGVGKIHWSGRGTFVPYLFLGLVGAAAASWANRRWFSRSRLCERRWRKVGEIAGQTTWLVLSGLLLALAWHAISGEGFLRNPAAIASVAQSYYATFMPKLTVEEVASRVANGEVLVVDARYAEDYAAGHVPGAINLSISLSPAEFRAKVADIPTDSQIVVYCQSGGCGFARDIGNQLALNGYRNVALFAEGWVAWEAYQKDQGGSSQTPAESSTR